MSQSRLLAVGSQRNSNSGTSDDDGGDGSTMLSALRKGDLDMVKHVIEPILEPLIRRIVKEELIQERILTSMKQNSGTKIHCSEPGSLELVFQNKLPSQILTGRPIIGENYSSIEIALVDVLTKEVVKHGPHAFAKVKIVVLPGDSDSNEGHDWTQEEMKENESLLRNAFLNLKEGIGSLDKISFKHTRDWMKKRMFRLGAQIVDNLNGTRVSEAKSGLFSLEDRRNKLNEKHYPPSRSDEVWRLKNICKGGRLHKRLSDENIKTVEDFLKQFFTNHQGLQNILGRGMPDMKFNDTVKHARTCQLDERYIYPPPSSQQKKHVVFNVVGQVVGVLSGWRYIPIDKLPETEKVNSQKLVLSAFEHWEQVVHCDDNSLLCNNALSASNSTMLECASGPNVATSHMIAEYDRTQPSTSQGIISSNNYNKTSYMIIDGMEFIYETLDNQYEHSGSPCQDPNHQMPDLMSKIQNIVKQFDQDLGSPAVTIDRAQRRKWLKLSCVLKMSVVLNFSLRKRTEDPDHVWKKQRLH